MKSYIPKGPPKEGAKFAWARPEFNEDVFEKTDVSKNCKRRQAVFERFKTDEMQKGLLHYWSEQGLKKELFDNEVNGGKGKYSVFLPENLEAGKKYPLVYDSHPGMMPINACEFDGFAHLAGKEKFIAVYPWNGGPSNDDAVSEFPRILDTMLEKGYPIDVERVYPVGFSSGSDATGAICAAWPERIAAISPNPGANMIKKSLFYENPDYYEKCKFISMPVICMGGTMDGDDLFPITAEEGIENYNIWMEKIVKIRDFTPLTLERSKEIVDSDKPVYSDFGFEFHEVSSFEMEGVHWNCGLYYNESKVCVAKFILGEGIPHCMTNSHSVVIWDFIKHFRRNVITNESIYAVEI